MSMRILNYVVLFLLLNCYVAIAGPLGYRDGRMIFKIKESYFSTNSNFDSRGSVVPLGSGRGLSTFTTTFSFTNDFSNSFSAFVLLDAPYGRSRSLDFERTRFTLADVKTGFDFSLLSGAWMLNPEFLVSLPIQSVSEDTDEMIVSEGATEFKVGTYLGRNFEDFSFYTYGGYNHRTSGRSSLFMYEGQLIKTWTNVQVTGGLSGYFSVTNDQYVDVPGVRGAVTTRVNGGSLRYYAVNPNLFELMLSAGVALSQNMFLRGGFNNTLWGSNSANGSTFWLSLSYVPPLSSKAQNREQKRHKTIEEEKKKEEFVPENYEEEQTVFENAVQTIEKENASRPVPTAESSEEDSELQNSKPNPVGVKLRKSKPQNSIKKFKKKRK